MTKDVAILKAVKVAGGVSELAKLLGITGPAISQWRRVPDQHVLKVMEITGLPLSVVRPDLQTLVKTLTPAA